MTFNRFNVLAAYFLNQQTMFSFQNNPIYNIEVFNVSKM